MIRSFFILMLLISSLAEAGMRLFEWRVKNTHVPLIFPVRDSERPEDAIKRYLKEFDKTPGLVELFQGETPYFESVSFKELNQSSNDREDRVLLQANRPSDYTLKEGRVERFKTLFQGQGQKSFLLLINPTLGLSQTEERAVFQLIYDHFALYVGMGGDDVDPKLAKQENFHSKNVVIDRDRAEMKLIQDFVGRGQNEKNPAKKSFYLGICRGSQLASVALGYKLIQDIPFQVGEHIAHGNDWHLIKTKKTTHNFLRQLGSRLHVNSLHHQAVRYREGGFLELAAISAEGIVEATEFKNGRGLLLQFHPELMNNKLGTQILMRVVRSKNHTGGLRCQGLF